jgi:hypothetical protein
LHLFLGLFRLFADRGWGLGSNPFTFDFLLAGSTKRAEMIKND